MWTWPQETKMCKRTDCITQYPFKKTTMKWEDFGQTFPQKKKKKEKKRWNYTKKKVKVNLHIWRKSDTPHITFKFGMRLKKKKI